MTYTKPEVVLLASAAAAIAHVDKTGDAIVDSPDTLPRFTAGAYEADE